MGTHSTYKCTTCSYEFEGSGQRDRGMFSFVYDTYSCLDCKKAFDLYVETIPGETIQMPVARTFLDKLFFKKQKFIQDFVEHKIPDAEVRCSFCEGNNVVQWNKRCPDCFSEMKWKGIAAMWD